MLDAATLEGFDSETFLIAPGTIAPPLVCFTLANDKPGEQKLWGRDNVGVLRSVLENDALHIVGHNVAYDVLVTVSDWPELWPLWRAAYDAGRVHDTKVREQLIDIALGRFRFEIVEDEEGEPIKIPRGYSLADIAQRRLSRTLDKGEDGWRLRYAELATVPVAEWPERATAYAVDDAITTRDVALDQDRELVEAALELTDEALQTRADLALHLIAARGLVLDLEAVDKLEGELRTVSAQGRAALAEHGIYRSDGSKDMARLRELVVAAYDRIGKAAPPTDSGDVSTAKATLIDSEDPVLMALGNLAGTEKLLTGFVPGLRAGGTGQPLVCRYNVLVESGRTSCAGVKVDGKKGVQLQNLPRREGVRDCFVPRPGHWFVSVDFDTLELRALAQVCLWTLGHSRLAEAFYAGIDPHIDFAARVLGIDYAEALARYEAGDPVLKNLRQQAKAANFGFPGGLGVKRFLSYAQSQYGVSIDFATANRLRNEWRAQWPEVLELQRRVSAALDPVTNTCDVEQQGSKRLRAGCSYTEACNTLFQGLAADGAKHALWNVVTQGPALNVHPVVFLHDEVVAEVPADSERATLAGEALARLMVEGMRRAIPDVPITAKPTLMDRWRKDAKPMRDARGLLVPWQPKASA